MASGLSFGASGSVWSAGRGFGVVSGHAAGVASGSRTTDSPLQGSGSAYVVESSLGSSTTGRFSVSADSVVLASIACSGSKSGFRGSGGGAVDPGSKLAPGTCGGMFTIAVSWDWRLGLVVCSP